MAHLNDPQGYEPDPFPPNPEWENMWEKWNDGQDVEKPEEYIGIVRSKFLGEKNEVTWKTIGQDAEDIGRAGLAAGLIAVGTAFGVHEFGSQFYQAIETALHAF